MESSHWVPGVATRRLALWRAERELAANQGAGPMAHKGVREMRYKQFTADEIIDFIINDMSREEQERFWHRIIFDGVAFGIDFVLNRTSPRPKRVTVLFEEI